MKHVKATRLAKIANELLRRGELIEQDINRRYRPDLNWPMSAGQKREMKKSQRRASIVRSAAMALLSAVDAIKEEDDLLYPSGMPKPFSPVKVRILHPYEHDDGGEYEIGEILHVERYPIMPVFWALMDGNKVIHSGAKPGVDFEFC
jgi:hypothetical protein